MAKKKICLDAGHDGKRNHSPAVKAYYESDMVWKLHLLLKSELERRGFEVITTRATQNTVLGVTARGKKAKGCDLFLSLHSNAPGSAVREDLDYPLVIVMLDGKGHALGRKLADCIEDTMGTNQGGRLTTKKGNNGEYYGVLRGAASVGTMGMILEHSFHTNTRSTKWLLDEGNLAKLAKAEAEVITNHFGVEKPVSKPTTTTDTKIDSVLEVQTWLNNNYATGLTRDGLYGSRTKAALVKALQKELGFTGEDVDGIFGKKTKAAVKNLRRGDEGDLVKVLQGLLVCNGYKGAYVDGSFGGGTEAAVEQYQQKKGLKVDGVAGSNTFTALCA